MTKEEFSEKYLKKTDVKSAMRKVYHKNIGDFHNDDMNRFFSEDKDYKQVIYEIIKPFVNNEDFKYRLPYETENAIYHLSFIANQSVMNDKNSALYDFLNLKAVDFISYIKENAWEQIKYYTNTYIYDKDTTIGELIIKANDDLRRGNIYRYNKAKATIVIILIYSFGFVFEAKREGGKI